GSRIEEQRSELPTPNITLDAEASDVPVVAPAKATSNSGATVPDEDFFSLIMRLQGGRMEDQRATVPLNNNLNRSTTASGNQPTQHNHSNDSNSHNGGSAINNNGGNGGSNSAANNGNVANGNAQSSSSNSGTGGSGGSSSVGKGLK
uniref:Uncharacterized protein n=1 Tax=Anopheles maculatus TaxID=74869 RepID=A0A182TCD0_9DIPT